MNKKGMVREFFLGANTYKGFHSFYEYVVPNIPKRLIILKGGPGTGKSTFLKKIVAEFSAIGYDMEAHRCSSDNDSLDAVRIVPYNIAVMDGTSPHLTDPKYPGVSDEIVNLGEYWDTANIQKHGNRIIEINKELKILYASSYRFLSAAKEIQDDIEALILKSFNMIEFRKFLGNYCSKISNPLDYKDKEANIRHLFHSSINSAGSVDYIEKTAPRDYRINYIKGEHYTTSTDLLEKIAENLIIKGYDQEIYHQPLNPNRLETIIIHDLKAVYTNDSLIEYKADEIIELENFNNKQNRYSYKEKIEINTSLRKSLMDEAINRIKSAKYLHDELEKYYIANIDFEGMQDLRNKIIDNIKNLCK